MVIASGLVHSNNWVKDDVKIVLYFDLNNFPWFLFGPVFGTSLYAITATRSDVSTFLTRRCSFGDLINTSPEAYRNVRFDPSMNLHGELVRSYERPEGWATLSTFQLQET